MAWAPVLDWVFERDTLPCWVVDFPDQEYLLVRDMGAKWIAARRPAKGTAGRVPMPLGLGSFDTKEEAQQAAEASLGGLRLLAQAANKNPGWENLKTISLNRASLTLMFSVSKQYGHWDVRAIRLNNAVPRVGAATGDVIEFKAEAPTREAGRKMLDRRYALELLGSVADENPRKRPIALPPGWSPAEPHPEDETWDMHAQWSAFQYGETPAKSAGLKRHYRLEIYKLPTYSGRLAEEWAVKLETLDLANKHYYYWVYDQVAGTSFPKNWKKTRVQKAALAWADEQVVSPLERLGRAADNPKIKWVPDRWRTDPSQYIRVWTFSKTRWERWSLTAWLQAGQKVRVVLDMDTTGGVVPPVQDDFSTQGLTDREVNRRIFAWARDQIYSPLEQLGAVAEETKSPKKKRKKKAKRNPTPFTGQRSIARRLLDWTTVGRYYEAFTPAGWYRMSQAIAYQGHNHYNVHFYKDGNLPPKRLGGVRILSWVEALDLADDHAAKAAPLWAIGRAADNPSEPWKNRLVPWTLMGTSPTGLRVLEAKTPNGLYRMSEVSWEGKSPSNRFSVFCFPASKSPATLGIRQGKYRLTPDDPSGESRWPPLLAALEVADKHAAENAPELWVLGRAGHSIGGSKENPMVKSLYWPPTRKSLHPTHVVPRTNPAADDIYDPRQEQLRIQKQAIYESNLSRHTVEGVVLPFRLPSGLRLDAVIIGNKGVRAVIPSIKKYMWRMGSGVQGRTGWRAHGSIQPTSKAIHASAARYAGTYKGSDKKRRSISDLLRSRQSYEETLGIARKAGFFRVTREPTAAGLKYFVWPLPAGQRIPRPYSRLADANRRAAALNASSNPLRGADWWIPPTRTYTKKELSEWLAPQKVFSPSYDLKRHR